MCDDLVMTHRMKLRNGRVVGGENEGEIGCSGSYVGSRMRDERTPFGVSLLAVLLVPLHAWTQPGMRMSGSRSARSMPAACSAVPPTGSATAPATAAMGLDSLPDPVGLSPWVALRGVSSCRNFADFMSHLRREQGDALMLDLRPVLPPVYLLQGKAANRNVFSALDVSLEQILQELITLLPVAARVPSEVDYELQKRVASLFSNAAVVNQRLPSFIASAECICDRWVGRPAAESSTESCTESSIASSAGSAGSAGSDERGRSGSITGSGSGIDRELGGGSGSVGIASLDVFAELSEFVLCSDLEVLYGRAFCDAHGPQLLTSFRGWIRNIASGGSPVTFFSELGTLLRETLAAMRADRSLYAGERSVLQVYAEQGALEKHDDDALVGLLSMTLMAAVFNTQVSLAWILVHLYSDRSLLERARDELRGCPNLADYDELAKLEFVNSCIDEAVRMHTMLPGNTVLRKAKRSITLGKTAVPEGAVLWLYPNAVHNDEAYFPEPKTFLPDAAAERQP